MLAAPPGWKAEAFAVCLIVASVSGWPTSNPATKDPTSLQRMTWSQGHRLLSHSLPREGPACPLPMPLTCACHGAANAPAKHLASFGRSHGSEEDKGGCWPATFLTSEHTIQCQGTMA